MRCYPLVVKKNSDGEGRAGSLTVGGEKKYVAPYSVGV